MFIGQGIAVFSQTHMISEAICFCPSDPKYNLMNVKPCGAFYTPAF